jgi:hypothetical protein
LARTTKLDRDHLRHDLQKFAAATVEKTNSPVSASSGTVTLPDVPSAETLVIATSRWPGVPSLVRVGNFTVEEAFNPAASIVITWRVLAED